ncbi:MAG TPA: serine hydrolase [Puia sp.]|nr:serine hydrolase [Puia sp.]
MFVNYIRIAWRSLGRRRAFSAINIFSLAIGLAACPLTILAVLLSPLHAAAQSATRLAAGPATAQSATHPATEPAAAQPSTGPTATRSDKSARIRDILQQYNLPGIQLIYTHGKHTEIYNLGTTGDSTHPVTPNTIFEAASLSKCVFAYVVLRLYDRGQLNLDTSLLAYLGTYNRFDPGNPAYSRITARMVLRHTTGLPNWGDSAGARLLFPPDSCFSYSGEGYVFLQHVVEKITGKTLDELAREEVFKPLKMTSSSYVWEPRFDSVSAFGDSPRAVKDHSTANAAYSLLTNAHDYTLFLKAVAKGQGLKPATHKMMLTPATPGNWFHHKPTAATGHICWGLGVGLQEYATGSSFGSASSSGPTSDRSSTSASSSGPTSDRSSTSASGPDRHNTPHPDERRGQAFWHWGDNGDFKAYYIVFPDTKESLVYFVHNWRGLFATQQLYDLFFGDAPCWSILWSGEGYHSPASIREFSTAVEARGFDKADDARKELLKNPGFDLSDEDLNEYGFLLMDKKRPRDAVAIFKLNLSLNPKSAMCFDSLAEGYEALGEKALALENFKRSLALNPKNEYAAKHIIQLETSLQTK